MIRTLFSILGAGALAAVLLASAAEAGTSIPSEFQMVDLGTLPGAYATHPEGINNASEVVGWTHGPQTQYRAFKWTAATGMVELPPPAGFTHNRAIDISENGIICGVAQNGFDGPTRPWRLIDGVYQLLPAGGACQPSFAYGVNNDGTVVGTNSGSGCGSSFAFYFSDADGLVIFPALSAIDINNNGVATGQGFPEAYHFTPATGVQLIGTLPDPYDQAEGRAINESNDVVGRAIQGLTGPDHWKAFLIADEAAPIEISPTLFARRSAEALNNLDHAVGSDGTTSSPNQYPWIWSAESGRVPLTTLVTLPPNYFNLNSPKGINDSDRIIAKAMRQTGPEVDAAGVLLIPVVQGDVNGDSTVDIDDLFAVIAAWGPCPALPAECPTDIDADGDADVDDLFIVIANWS